MAINCGCGTAADLTTETVSPQTKTLRWLPRGTYSMQVIIRSALMQVECRSGPTYGFGIAAPRGDQTVHPNGNSKIGKRYRGKSMSEGREICACRWRILRPMAFLLSWHRAIRRLTGVAGSACGTAVSGIAAEEPHKQTTLLLLWCSRSGRRMPRNHDGHIGCVFCILLLLCFASFFHSDRDRIFLCLECRPI